jgi:hypothetical protein
VKVEASEARDQYPERRQAGVAPLVTVSEGSFVNFLRSETVITEQEISRDSRRDEA